MIRFTLDGATLEAAPGETIWTAAQRAGVAIPHLCHLPQPGYRPDGNCRACLVEIEGERVLAASCIRTPREGMVVRSESSTRAQSTRRMVFELLLADAETADFGVRRNIQSNPLQPLRRIMIQLIPLDHAAFGGFCPKENILANRHLLHKRQLLVNDGDAGFFRIGNALELLLLAADDDVPAIGAGWIQAA